MRRIKLDLLLDKYDWCNLARGHITTSADEAYRFFRWFQKYTKKDISEINILDLGCSNGNFMGIAHELGAKGVYVLMKNKVLYNKLENLQLKILFLQML